MDAYMHEGGGFIWILYIYKTKTHSLKLTFIYFSNVYNKYEIGEL